MGGLGKAGTEGMYRRAPRRHPYGAALERFFREAKLSGGEEQKLALARALFAQRGAYILDEPSAALDSKSEIALYDFFRKLTGQKTVIFVSHRLFSCLKCDKIFVMDHGKLVQEGTHEQLVEVEGKYRETWQSQIQDFVEEGD